jgi:peptidyl-prolyl cis-trans isomerase A (cyclophilin A)
MAMVGVGVLCSANVLFAAEKAPETFQVKFETSAGDFVVDVTRAWAPLGADRFHEAVKAGFFDECRFFRVVPNFMVQFGINGDPEVQTKWRDATIKDDPDPKSNTKGMDTFATSGPNSRTTQMFINFKDNSFLDNQGFAPFGKVSDEGMKIVDKINAEYGERPNQGSIQRQGNEYLKASFPKLDHIKKATIVEKKKE